MAAFLKEHVTILTDTDVTDVDKAAHTVHYEAKAYRTASRRSISFLPSAVWAAAFLPNGVLKTVFR